MKRWVVLAGFVLVISGCTRKADPPPARSAESTAPAGPKCVDLAASKDRTEDAFSPLVTFVFREHEFDQARFDSLTGAQRALWAVHELDGEVNNGGFNQYFFNTGGARLDLAVKGYGTFGSKEKQSLAARALELWKTDRERVAKVRAAGTMKAFSESYKNDPYDALDAAWYKVKDDEVEGYVRAHQSEFCVQ